jgi:hypothetical protein
MSREFWLPRSNMPHNSLLTGTRHLMIMKHAIVKVVRPFIFAQDLEQWR